MTVAVALSELSERQREQAMERLAVLRPHLEDGVPLARAAAHAGVPARTAQRWLARYRAHGLVGLARSDRADARTARRRGLRGELDDRVALAEQILPRQPPPAPPANPRPKDTNRVVKLKRYRNP